MRQTTCLYPVSDLPTERENRLYFLYSIRSTFPVAHTHTHCSPALCDVIKTCVSPNRHFSQVGGNTPQPDVGLAGALFTELEETTKH